MLMLVIFVISILLFLPIFFLRDKIVLVFSAIGTLLPVLFAGLSVLVSGESDPLLLVVIILGFVAAFLFPVSIFTNIAGIIRKRYRLAHIILLVVNFLIILGVGSIYFAN